MAIDVSCPECKEKLRIPDDWLGQTVECPACEHSFTAVQDAGGASSHAVQSSVRSSGPPPLPPGIAGPPEMVPEVAADDDEFASPIDEEPEERARPRKKQARRRSSMVATGHFNQLQRKRSSMLTPHRGFEILALGVSSILCCWLPLISIGSAACGYYAYQMGSYDLREMEAMRMDSAGRGLTQVGRMLGAVGVVLSAIAIALNLTGLVLTLIRAAVGP
jgi:hypothetical protein